MPPVDWREPGRYAYLDRPEVRAELGVSAEHPVLNFYLEGVHCTACLWLLEKLPELAPEVRAARLDFGRSRLRVELAPGQSFAPACALLEELGYRPHLLRDPESGERFAQRESRRSLVRIAVAGASAGNVMLFSVALYAGVEGGLATLFRWLTIAVATPAFIYSALPFYRSAFSALRARRISIDLPVSLALLVGFTASLLSAARGSNEIYLDSLTGLVFLLLSSRFLLIQLQRKNLGVTSALQSLAPALAKRVRTANGETVADDLLANQLRAGDWIEVAPGESFAADGRVVSGESFLDSSLLTGESLPSPVRPGESVYCGTRNLSARLVVAVEQNPEGSRLGALIERLRTLEPKAAPVSVAADRAARWFLGAVLSLATGVLLYYAPTDLHAGLSRALALVIVACPCALALATPLTLAKGHQRALLGGALLKDPGLLERLSTVRAIVFDKTGTLTEGCLSVVRWHDLREDPIERRQTRSAALSLEKGSRHPAARAIVRYLEELEHPAGTGLTEFAETPGVGVSGRVDGQRYSIRRLPDSAQIGVFSGEPERELWLATIELRDRIRPDSAPSLDELRSRGYRLFLATGDHATVARDVGSRLGFTSAEIHAACGPERKAELVASLQACGLPTLVVGDGANDAAALAAADVGVATHGSLEISLAAADVYLPVAGVAPVIRLLEAAGDTRRTLIRNYIFSAAYNAISATLALLGVIGPLFAAIVMPVSALTVFLSTHLAFGSRDANRGRSP